MRYQFMSSTIGVAEKKTSFSWMVSTVVLLREVPEDFVLDREVDDLTRRARGEMVQHGDLPSPNGNSPTGIVNVTVLPQVHGNDQMLILTIEISNVGLSSEDSFVEASRLAAEKVTIPMLHQLCERHR